MPIDYNARLDEEDTTVGTPSGIVSTSTPQNNPSMQGSGQFSNLQDYVRANEGSRNATATKVGEDVNSRYNTALSGITAGANQIGEKGQALTSQRNQFNTIVSGAGTSAITPEQIASARNMALGISGVNSSPRTEASQILSQREIERQGKASELQNIGAGSGIQNYLRSVRSNPSNSTSGELRLDEFLTKQTPEGSSQLQNAATKGTSLAGNSQLQNAMNNVESSYAALSPQSLSEYVRQQRGDYQTGLGNIDRARVSRVATERRGVSDMDSARANYENSLSTARANDQALRDYAASVNQANSNIASYNNQIAQLDQFAGTRNNAELERIMRENAIAENEAGNVVGRFGNRSTALRNDAMRGLQSLREQRQAEIDASNRAIADREAQLAASVQSVDPYSLYNSDVANARTRQDALSSGELARLQALYSIAGDDQDYRNYLAGGL